MTSPTMHDRTVRDLWWACTSAELLAEHCCPLTPRFDREELALRMSALVADPAPLHEFVAPSRVRRPFRLGAYFEDLVAFYVGEVLGCRFERGIPIRASGRTLGELDLLWGAGDGSRHWELAVKFYMFVPGLVADPGECFVGPQVRDRLHLKVARLRDHQLPLSRRAEAASVLSTWEPVVSEAFVRGRLFYPAQSDWRAGQRADEVARGHERGWWCHLGAVRDLLPDAAGYAWLDRSHWLAPIDARHDRVQVIDPGVVIDTAATMDAGWTDGAPHSRVLVGLDGDGRECHRGFVVSMGWPGIGG